MVRHQKSSFPGWSSGRPVEIVRRRPPPLPSLIGVPLVTLHVDTKRSVQVHQILLDQASPGFVFRFNVTHGGLKGDTNIKLIHEHEGLVELLVEWLYAGPGGSVASIPPEDRFLPLVRMYQFADKYGFTTLQNDIITEFFILNREGHFPPLAAVRHVFERMSPKSTLAILMVAWHVFYLDTEHLPSMEDMEDMPCFTARLARAYMEKLKNQFDDPFEKQQEEFFVAPRPIDTSEYSRGAQRCEGD